jgi:hypothetical protein
MERRGYRRGGGKTSHFSHYKRGMREEKLPVSEWFIVNNTQVSPDTTKKTNWALSIVSCLEGPP